MVLLALGVAAPALGAERRAIVPERKPAAPTQPQPQPQAAPRPPPQATPAARPSTATAPQPRPTRPSDPFRVLGDGDITRYRVAFSRLRDGEWSALDRALVGLEDPILLGHVQALRYLHPKSPRTGYPELVEWLRRYRDHHEAPRIYRLAVSRQPRGERPPPQPGVNQINISGDDEGEPLDLTPPAASAPYRSPMRRTPQQAREAAAAQQRIRTTMTTNLSTAERELAALQLRNLLDGVEIDQLSADIAARHFYAGTFEAAFALSSGPANRSRRHVDVADWIAGLAAWRLGKYEDARHHFEALAQSASVSDWNKAAGAYWAGRANLVTRRPDQVTRWFELAAKWPHTFYGLLGSAMLGDDPAIPWEVPPIDDARARDLLTHANLRRAIALAEVGQTPLAERELRQMLTGSDRASAELLLAIGDRLGLAGVTVKLARALFEPGDRFHASAAYPLPKWPLINGYALDRALVFAFIRQESEFNAFARSPAGARGLMQLMPATASFVAGDRGLRDARRSELYEPDVNLDLGQRYLTLLLDDELVRGNLYHLAAAYNAGPGNLNKWLRRLPDTDDPLMLIESLPARETRLFIERVLANYWIYRMRLGQDMSSLADAAGGRAPSYAPQEPRAAPERNPRR
jgi:soluble lytic murein transglycosylase-like protein